MPQVRVLRTTELTDDELAAVRSLLGDAFDGDFSDDDWHHTLGGSHVVVVDPADTVVAHAALVSRSIGVGDRRFQAGYVEGVATAPHRRGEGLGSLVMSRVAQVLTAKFELGVLSTDRHSFYERLGWERWRGPSGVRSSDGATVFATPDEDDGIMVRRFGPSATVELTSMISCDPRTGDHW